MQKANANLFPGATFSLDQNGDVSLCHPLQLVSDGLHGCSFAEDNVQRRQIKRCSGFGIVNQGHFFLSRYGSTATLQYSSHSTLTTNS